MIQMKDNIVDFFRKNKYLLGGLFIFSAVIYSIMMTNSVVNQYDGYWRKGASGVGYWELSIGRWFWLYIDRLRFEACQDPFVNLLSLGIYIIAIVIAIKALLGKHEITMWKKGVIGAIFLSNVAICVALSYRYMSPTFAISFFLSVMAAYVLIRYRGIASVVVSSILICFMMGAYQANIGTTCLILLFAFLSRIYKSEKTAKEFILFWVRALVAAICGGVLYVLILRMHLYVFDVEMGTYSGFREISLGGILTNLPKSIKESYTVFCSYFFGMAQSMVKSNRLQEYGIYYMIFAVLLAAVLWKVITTRKNKPGAKIVFLIGICLIPLFANSVHIIAYTAGISIQMTTPMALVIPGLLCLLATMKEREGKVVWGKYVVAVMILALLYGNIFMVVTDQEAMKYGQNAVDQFGERVINELQARNMLNSEDTYCFVGRPSNHDLFYWPEIYDKANSYAQHGAWWEYGNEWQYWKALTEDSLGIKIKLADATVCSQMPKLEEVKNMDCFLRGEFVKEINGVIVVRIS